MARAVFDFGNALGKVFDPRQDVYMAFRHSIALLTEGEWQRVVGRGLPPNGMARVNGQPVAIGDAARNHVIAEQPRGAARYKKEYYGLALGYALSEVFRRNVANVSLVASHAPIDADYARNLKVAAAGVFEVECRHGQLTFQVREVHTCDEPLCGYSHFIMTEKGEERRRNPLRDVTTLVVDCGGHTVDVAAIDPGGQIDVLSLHSTRTGVLRLMADFEAALRANNTTLFQDSGNLDVRRVENAITTGTYKFGRVDVPCEAEAYAARMGLVNDVIQVINSAGGAGNFDYVLMTGGGAALIVDDLRAAYSRIDFLMADDNRDLMKFANVFGGAKLALLMETMGVW